MNLNPFTTYRVKVLSKTGLKEITDCTDSSGKLSCEAMKGYKLIEVLETFPQTEDQKETNKLLDIEIKRRKDLWKGAVEIQLGRGIKYH